MQPGWQINHHRGMLRFMRGISTSLKDSSRKTVNDGAMKLLSQNPSLRHRPVKGSAQVETKKCPGQMTGAQDTRSIKTWV